MSRKQDKPVGVFGVGAPLGLLAALFGRVRDVTLPPGAAAPQVDPFVEPFMDGFARSVLRRLANGVFNDLEALVFLRESPGAVHACQYAMEFARRGLLPEGAPEVVLLNILPSDTAAARAFNLSELARLRAELPGLTRGRASDGATVVEGLEALLQAQFNGAISGAAAFRKRAAVCEGRRGEAMPTDEPETAGARRIALLGAPLGSAVLHEALEREGRVVLDQQALDQAWAAGCGLRGLWSDGGEEVSRPDDEAAHLRRQAANPYAARQPKPLYLQALRADLSHHQIEDVFWQVDSHDDLWGWLMPGVRALSAELGIGFHDLGRMPRWPDAGDVSALAIREAKR